MNKKRYEFLKKCDEDKLIEIIHDRESQDFYNLVTSFKALKECPNTLGGAVRINIDFLGGKPLIDTYIPGEIFNEFKLDLIRSLELTIDNYINGSINWQLSIYNKAKEIKVK